MGFDGRMRTALLAGVVALATSAPALALPIVRYTVSDLGGGIWEYQLTVDNDGGAEPLSGLNVLYANSVFGLDDQSVIGTPSGWMAFAPLPPFADDLNYFSLQQPTDVPVDGVLSGFSFQSGTDPDTLTGGDFGVEGIGADSALQIDLGVALLVPEPASAILLALGMAGLSLRRRRHSTTIVPSSVRPGPAPEPPMPARICTRYAYEPGASEQSDTNWRAWMSPDSMRSPVSRKLVLSRHSILSATPASNDTVAIWSP
jgi:hypothetical protein